MELPYKRRLRERKRRIVTTLTLAGWEAYPFESGPFHVCADRRDESRRIRIVFGSCDRSDTDAVAKARLPQNCLREIWQVSEDGRTMVVAKITPKQK